MTVSSEVSWIFLFLLTLSGSTFAQVISYTQYRTSFDFVTSCPTEQYYDTALLRCSPCPTGAQQMATDNTRCDCSSNSSYYGINQGGGSLTCESCRSGFVRSTDGFGCTSTISTCSATGVTIESTIDGSLIGTSASLNSVQPRYGERSCTTCASGTQADQTAQRCVPCAATTPRTNLNPGATIECCSTSTLQDGMCLREVISTTTTISETFLSLNRFASPFISLFIRDHLQAAFYLCRMNLNSTTAQPTPRTLLSNATACHVLGNMVAMQFYYRLDGYAYDYYDDYIWESQRSPSVWTTASLRPSIPFLAYPTTFYQEVSSTGYNWIPSSFKANDTLNLKFAKYSATGQYLGMVDAVDAQIQLCNGGYTDGRPAFTLATSFKKTCYIRAAALWNSPLYDTIFYDPYMAYTTGGVSYMIATPTVIVNHQSTTGSFPNKNAEESLWSYHRRFFLLDRVSGVNTENALQNIHYAKSIKVLSTLTTDTNYILPPVIVIEYGELSLSDVAAGTVVQVSFESQYRMNLDIHIRDIWISIGLLSAAAFAVAFFRTNVYQTRTGKLAIDLMTILKIALYTCYGLATVFFIGMGGIAIWWLIFFKGQSTIYLLLPTAAQQASFTSLVSIAFGLKTIDILHLIIRQSNIEIFFIDWENSKKEKKDTVPVWRSYFAANEFIEIQTFRRVNFTFQLLFVLFLLKVINLENIGAGQPGVNLFPSSTDYQAEYNGILRVGIAFSIWMATGLVQYLFYVIFYKRFVEDRILNFIDLCSVLNISVIIFDYSRYGYYIHGRSPFGTSDVNIKQMIVNLEKESLGMIGTRGLEITGRARTDSNQQNEVVDQTFIVRVTGDFRNDYNRILYSPLNRLVHEGERKLEQAEANNIMETYNKMNEFLCTFINRSHVNHRYVTRFRTFIEKFLNYEFYGQEAGSQAAVNQFLIDREQNFTNILFYGYEFSLMMWNMSTFLFVDYFAFNYVLAAIITYLLNLIAVKMRSSLGRKNLARKTLIPKEFLL